MSMTITNELRERVAEVLGGDVRITPTSRAERCAELSTVLFGTTVYGQAVEDVLAVHAVI